MSGFLGRFFHDPHVKQAFGAQGLLAGVNPDSAPAVLATLPYFAIDQGVWYPSGGFHSVVEELGQLVRKGGGVVAAERRNRPYCSLVTCVAASRNASTHTRWIGRSQS